MYYLGAKVKLYTYTLPIVIISFIYWFYLHRKFVSSREYAKKILSARKEFLLYLFIILLFVFPLLSTLKVSYDLIVTEGNYDSEKIHLKYIVIKDTEYKYKCTYDEEEKSYVFNDEGKEFCSVKDNERILLDKMINSLASTHSINSESLKLSKTNLYFIENIDIKGYIENIVIFFFIIVPFLIMYFTQAGFKHWIITLVYPALYLIVFYYISLYFSHTDTSTSIVWLDEIIEKDDMLSIIISNLLVTSIVLFFILTPLLLGYIFLKKYRQTLYFNIIIYTIGAVLVVILAPKGFLKKLDLVSYEFHLYVVCILILLFFIKYIRKHIIYLVTNPIE